MRTLAPAFGYHCQRTVAFRTSIAQKNNPIVEATDLLDEFLHCGGHIESEPDDIHFTTDLYCTGFWFFGVNLRLQSLQCRILLIPICLVTLFPLLVVLLEPQYGHLNGLPLGMNITSAIPLRDLSI